MTGERARGAVLFGTAAVLVAAGATWWFRAAPDDQANDQIQQWRAAVQQLLPETELQEYAETAAMAAGADQMFESSVTTGKYVVAVVCRGGPGTVVRISLSQDSPDSGLGLNCSGSDAPETLEVGLADAMHLNVTVGDTGPVVVRYTLERVRE